MNNVGSGSQYLCQVNRPLRTGCKRTAEQVAKRLKREGKDPAEVWIMSGNDEKFTDPIHRNCNAM